MNDGVWFLLALILLTALFGLVYWWMHERRRWRELDYHWQRELDYLWRDDEDWNVYPLRPPYDREKP